MNDPLRQKQKELLTHHTANGCINVRKLCNGTRIVIKTEDEVYELEVGTAKFGVVLLASDGNFENRDKAVLMGSLDPVTNVFLTEIIGEGLRIVLRPRKGRVIRTKPVYYARIVGETYEYVMWGDE
ncbi:MAG: hypothetical protein ACYSUB_01590 [Planctomycetota bacterium]|jgi:hypothetical protein